MKREVVKWKLDSEKILQHNIFLKCLPWVRYWSRQWVYRCEQKGRVPALMELTFKWRKTNKKLWQFGFQ